MIASKSGTASPAAIKKLRNFDLTVEEIRILKALSELTKALEDIERKDAKSARIEYFRSEIRQLEDQLDEVRENTLLK